MYYNSIELFSFWIDFYFYYNSNKVLALLIVSSVILYLANEDFPKLAHFMINYNS